MGCTGAPIPVPRRQRPGPTFCPYSPKCVEKLSKKSLGGDSREEIAGIPQRNEPTLRRFVGIYDLLLVPARLFRQFRKGISRNFALTAFSETRSKGIGGLLLDHRLGWLSGRYGVCVPMHYPPLTIIGPKDHRRAQGVGGDLLPPSYLGL